MPQNDNCGVRLAEAIAKMNECVLDTDASGRPDGALMDAWTALMGALSTPSAIPWELRRMIEDTLQYYGRHSDARMGPRTGGVVQGCPRGEPYLDSGERADEAQVKFQEWLASRHLIYLAKVCQAGMHTPADRLLCPFTRGTPS